MGPLGRLRETVTRARHVEPREAVWGAVIVLAIVWFFRVQDPVLAAAAIPVEIVATLAIVWPHVRSPDGADEESTEPTGTGDADGPPGDEASEDSAGGPAHAEGGDG